MKKKMQKVEYTVTGQVTDAKKKKKKKKNEKITTIIAVQLWCEFFIITFVVSFYFRREIGQTFSHE